VDSDERRRALWVVNANGRGKPRRVSADGEHVSSAAWTPDGTRLVYSACPVATINSQWFESELKTVTARGTGRRTISPVRGHLLESKMHVSSDGRSLLLCEPYDDRDLFHDVAKVVDLKTGDRQRVHPRTDMRSVAPQWLPDGAVLFESGVGVTCGLYSCTIGGTPIKLNTGEMVSTNAAIAGGSGMVFYLGSGSQEPD
jgi:Tol biopolymer transport system component